MKKITHYFAYLIALILVSCSSSKQMLYLQDVDVLKKQQMEQKVEIKIQEEDLLSIIVNSRNPELTRPFNLIGSNETADSRIGYTVDTSGNIDFPVLGKMHVAGLSRVGLQDSIKKKLIEADLIKDPIVIVQFLNFKICMLGEVAHPGELIITGDRITLFEALSMAGDITVNGRRDRVAIIRENEGVRTILFNDTRSSEIFTSPYYYLQQNDIVYVEPTKVKTQTGLRSNLGLVMSISSLLIGVSSFALLFFK